MSWFPNFLSPSTGLIAAAVCGAGVAGALFPEASAARDGSFFDTAVEEGDSGSPSQCAVPKAAAKLALDFADGVVARACLALARPVTFFKPGAGKTTVILIDRSASMSATDIEQRKTFTSGGSQATGKRSRLDYGARRIGDGVAFDDQAETVNRSRRTLRRCGRRSIASRPAIARVA